MNSKRTDGTDEFRRTIEPNGPCNLHLVSGFARGVVGHRAHGAQISAATYCKSTWLFLGVGPIHHSGLCNTSHNLQAEPCCSRLDLGGKRTRWCLARGRKLYIVRSLDARLSCAAVCACDNRRGCPHATYCADRATIVVKPSIALVKVASVPEAELGLVLLL